MTIELTRGDTLTCSYGGVGEEINDLNPLEQQEDKAYDCYAVSQSQGTGLDCFTSGYLFPSAVNKLAMS